MRSIWVKAVWPAVAAAAATLLAAGCSGGSGQPGTASNGDPFTVQKMDSFAACMRGHGLPDFYFSPRGSSTPSPGSNGVVLGIGGYQVTGVNPQTAQFQSAMKACRHIIGQHQPPPGVQEKQLRQLVKAVACMHSHGYPDLPDPSLAPGGGIEQAPAPASVDTSSPQFLKAAKACGMGG
jgi:hypothetical protein